MSVRPCFLGPEYPDNLLRSGPAPFRAHPAPLVPGVDEQVGRNREGGGVETCSPMDEVIFALLDHDHQVHVAPHTVASSRIGAEIPDGTDLGTAAAQLLSPGPECTKDLILPRPSEHGRIRGSHG